MGGGRCVGPLPIVNAVINRSFVRDDGTQEEPGLRRRFQPWSQTVEIGSADAVDAHVGTAPKKWIASENPDSHVSDSCQRASKAQRKTTLAFAPRWFTVMGEGFSEKR